MAFEPESKPLRTLRDRLKSAEVPIEVIHEGDLAPFFLDEEHVQQGDEPFSL